MINRRQFLSLAGKVASLAAALILPIAPQQLAPEPPQELGQSQVPPEDLGGYLVPKEYADAIINATKQAVRGKPVSIEQHMSQVSQELARGMALELDRQILYGDGENKPIGVLSSLGG